MHTWKTPAVVWKREEASIGSVSVYSEYSIHLMFSAKVKSTCISHSLYHIFFHLWTLLLLFEATEHRVVTEDLYTFCQICWTAKFGNCWKMDIVHRVLWRKAPQIQLNLLFVRFFSFKISNYIPLDKQSSSAIEYTSFPDVSEITNDLNR